MKIGNVEGSPEEIKGLFENNGLNLAQYVNANPSIDNRKSHNIYILISVIAFLAINCILWIVDCSDTYSKILIISDIAVLGLIVFLIHQRFDKYILSGFIFFIGIIIMSVSLGYLTPEEAVKKMEKNSHFSAQDD